MQDLERFLEQLRADVAALASNRLPVVLTYKRAAFELSVGLTKLKSMVKAGLVQTCELGDRRGIPSSEILRIARPKTPPPEPRRSGGRKAQPRYSVAEELAKLDAARKKRR